ncbi:glycoside hydrolase family 97 catalytic domain-containing protein [Streptomyces sp. MS2.AVA.5]|uniref:Glycoside hydrolase family 97 catalytic domain-containing protein n=1 Tax=Streptomyces achmelvichensis TaxID=3134111 RepID=A0ACC6Q6K3_9ACTN
MARWRLSVLTGSPSSKFGLLTWLAVVLSTVLGVGTLTAPASAEERKGGSWTVTRQTGAPGRLSADVRLDGTDGTLSFAVRRDGATVLEPAPLGIVTDAADLTTGLRLRDRDTREVTERYTTTTGKERRRTARMTQTRFSFTGDGGARLDLDVRVSDDGVAYRYVLPDEDGVTVLREASAFQLPAASPAWLMPYTVNYERPRNETTAGGAAAGDYGYPSLFRSGAGFVLLTESDVDGRYAGSRLTHEAGSARYTVRLADERISSVGPLATPWRTAVIGDLATVTESTLVDDLAPASRIRDTSWIRPGRVAWSWLAGFGAAQRSLETQQRFVDYSAAHGWEYTLVDDGWKTTDWMPQLITYAQQRGVKVLLWMHWSDLDTAAERAEVLPRIKKWGASGLKIDFMDSDSQERFRWYDDILEATAEHKLLVNFHGSTLPHGIQRTWPQVMTMEAVYGAEQGNVSVADVTTLPFTRNAVGSMDYTPMGFQFGTRNTSDAAELALSVVYESGFQNYAGSVQAYRDRPQLERFLEQVPTVWDESRLLSGHPGDGAAFARRNGDRWFLGSVTAGGPATERVPLGFLGSGRWRVEVVRDGADGLIRESRIVDRRDTLSVPTLRNGGFAALVCRDRPGRATCDEPVRRAPLTSLTATPQKAEADPGGSVAVDGRFLVEEFGPAADVRLTASAPSGWTVRGAGAEAEQLPTGSTLDANWTVQVPKDTAYGNHDVVVTAEYRAPGASPRTPPLRSLRTVRVFVSPPGVDFVSDLPFATERNGWGPVERDLSNGENSAGDGAPLTIRRATYDKGLGMHAEGEVAVDIDGAYDRFTAQVGIDDEVSGEGTVVFQVIGDGRVLATTNVLSRADAAHPIDVDVTGVRRLTLRATDGGDGINFDHADWGDAQLRSAQAS